MYPKTEDVAVRIKQKELVAMIAEVNKRILELYTMGTRTHIVATPIVNTLNTSVLLTMIDFTPSREEN